MLAAFGWNVLAWFCWGILVLFLRYQVERRHQQYAALEAKEALEANV
jgi:heme exporter protein C